MPRRLLYCKAGNGWIIFPISFTHKMKVGVLILAELRKILISLPDNLLKEIDNIVSVERTNRSEFVREAMRLYIREKRKIQIMDRMKKGYLEMAEINIKLAEVCYDADCDQQQIYEERLGELE